MDDPGLSDQHAAAWSAYQRMRVRLAGQINRDLAVATGLSEADVEILLALLATSTEPVRALALRCGLAWEKSRLSHQLRRMEGRGLIVREDCPEDHRGAVVRITPPGRDLAEQARSHYHAAVHRYVMSVLSADQIASLEVIADTLLAGLDDQHNEPATSPIVPETPRR